MSDHPGFLRVPASFFGIVLGVIGHGNVWRVARRAWQLPSTIGEALEWLVALIWLVLVLLYLAKWLFEKTHAVEELRHPMQCCFAGLVGVTAAATVAVEPSAR